ncbi:glycoside hydrolase family 3 C-terminal domain-containing protein [uncultured Draconibacterium sp.]|uniref:beta-glucosidase n=1 Tax=uncultured Draconibacterium sp. TaxID=1573823 RepID=UPI0029C63FB7|nr:glycoside hydrolase family 3 C-terminal domain-containing protein [uncultured Draconibacterium sp.]
MKVFRIILYIILSILIIGFVAFQILKYNPKPELIALERRPLSEQEIDQQARSLVDQMTIEEKVQMMTPVLKSNLKMFLEVIGDGMKYNQPSYQAGGNERLNIPTMRFFDGPRGMVSGEATCFPVAMARAAAFDRNLEMRVGEAIGKEIRANNGNYFGGVCINLLRHPAGGRAQEAYGEDSYLLGQMGTSLMKGVQKYNVMACIKHYAVNNQENTRFSVDVEVDERVLREVYLPHFKECIDNGAASVMGAYNKFRGDQCCESPHLLRTVLKEEWGFKGFTISDFLYGVRNTELAANAGLDIEMPSTEDYGSKLLEAVNDGKVSENVVDESAFRIARTVLKFETAPDPMSEYPTSLIGSRDHISLALEAAEKSMVLMQNENNVLPLNKNEIKNVLVVGQLATTENIGDHGSSQVRPAYVVTPMQGLNALYGEKIKFTHITGEDLEMAKNQASEADAIIFVVGYNHDDEGEFIEMGGNTVGGDRKSLRLHENESKLLQELGPLNTNSVAVLIGGSAIIVEEWKDRVSGIIHAFYPGMEGGTAIAKTIFGDNNPGGKLPFTVASDESHYPTFDRLATEVTYDRYHGYIKLDYDGNKAAFPFGFGLSYTTFTQDSATISVENDQITAEINVTNTGELAGDQALQLYIGFDNSIVEREHKLLKGFRRVTLQPGESKRVQITCPLDKIKWYNSETKSWELEKMKYQAYIGSSSDEDDLIELAFTLD